MDGIVIEWKCKSYGCCAYFVTRNCPNLGTIARVRRNSASLGGPFLAASFMNYGPTIFLYAQYILCWIIHIFLSINKHGWQTRES